MMVSCVPDMDGAQAQGIFVQIDDLTERKRMEDLLFEEKELVRLTLQSIGDAVLCTDASGHVTYINPVAEKITGWQAFHAAGRDIDEVAPSAPPTVCPRSIRPAARCRARKPYRPCAASCCTVATAAASTWKTASAPSPTGTDRSRAP